MDRIIETILDNLLNRIEKLEAKSSSSDSLKKEEYKEMTLKNPDEPITDKQMSYLKDLSVYLENEIPNQLTQAKARELIKIALENKSKGKEYNNITSDSEPKEKMEEDKQEKDEIEEVLF